MVVDSKGVAESGSSSIAVSCFGSLPQKWSENTGTHISTAGMGHPNSIHGPPLTGNAIRMYSDQHPTLWCIQRSGVGMNTRWL